MWVAVIADVACDVGVDRVVSAHSGVFAWEPFRACVRCISTWWEDGLSKEKGT